MKLKYILFFILSTVLIISCQDTTVRPAAFVQTTGNAFTELTKDATTGKTMYSTVFLAKEYYQTPLKSALVITPAGSNNPGSYNLNYTEGDSSVMVMKTNRVPFDTLMTENHGLYRFYITSSLTGEMSYTLDTIVSTPADSVINLSYFFSWPNILRMNMVWDPFPQASEYEVNIFEYSTGLLIYRKIISDTSIYSIDIADTDPEWISYPIRGKVYLPRIYSRDKDSLQKIRLSTYCDWIPFIY